MDGVPLFAWKASQHAFFILRHHLFKHAKWPQVDIKIKVCMRKQTMALPKILRRLEEFRLRRHVPTISRILESGHAKPRNLRKKKKKIPFCVYIVWSFHQQSYCCWGGVQPHSRWGTQLDYLFSNFFWIPHKDNLWIHMVCSRDFIRNNQCWGIVLVENPIIECWRNS